jgi:hypothetical protein
LFGPATLAVVSAMPRDRKKDLQQIDESKKAMSQVLGQLKK